MKKLYIYCISSTILLFSIVRVSEGLNVTQCNSTSFCESQIHFSVCINHTCKCEQDHYIYEDSNIQICAPCPGVGHYCGDSGCCMHSDYLTCSYNICRCLNPYDSYYCWDDDAPDTARLEFLAQFILGLGLIFALAILGSLIWRICTKQEMQQTQNALQSQGSFSSLNSLQRLVLMRLQDRPPPYNLGFQPWKLYSVNGASNDQGTSSDAPPPYTISNQVPMPTPNGGIDNPVFTVEEIQQQDTASAPPAPPPMPNAIESNNKLKGVENGVKKQGERNIHRTSRRLFT